MAPIEESPLSPRSSDSTVALQIQQFLDEWHYRVIHSNLAKSCDRQQAVVAALRLFESQGVQYAPGEIQSLAELDEFSMIQSLVAKFPEDFKASFEHFTLQLQLIVSTATGVRKVIEEGQPTEIATTMDSNKDGSGIVNQILKQAIVQAGHEVSDIRNRHISWVNNTEGRVVRLIRCADDAQEAQQELRKLQAQLGSFGGTQNEKSKKAMSRFAAGNDQLLQLTVFGGWRGHQLKVKSEQGIRDKFEEEIAGLELKLMNMRQKSLDNVRAVMSKGAADGDRVLLTSCCKGWFEGIQETKREAGALEEQKAMEAKLASYAQGQAANTKKVMERMSAGTDSALVSNSFSSWTKALEEAKNEKAAEEAVRLQEEKTKAFLEKKKGEAQGVIDKMKGSSDSGLLTSIMTTWSAHFIEEQKAKQMDEMINGNGAKFASFNGRQKDNAVSVAERTNAQIKENLLIRHFAAWATDAKLERIMRYYNAKMDSKKNQLQSVQHLFRSFANQLDQGLKAEGSARGDGSEGRQRNDGAVSLPNIHKKP